MPLDGNELPRTENAKGGAGMVTQLLLTVEEAAKRLSIGRSRFYQLMNADQIETVLIGRSRRVLVSALEKYVSDLQTENNAKSKS